MREGIWDQIRQIKVEEAWNSRSRRALLFEDDDDGNTLAADEDAENSYRVVGLEGISI